MNVTVDLSTAYNTYSLWESPNDDHPTTYSKPGWRIAVRAVGIVNWGPYKFRRTAKRKHSGTATMELCSIERFFCKSEDPSKAELAEVRTKAESYAIEVAAGFESRGFKVDLVFEGKTPFDVQPGWHGWEPKNPRRWLSEVPLICRRYGSACFGDLLPLKTAS